MIDKKRKLRYIDAIRGIAILSVIAVHTSQHGTNLYPKLIQNLMNEGARGVQLFYVASAFTLFLSYNYRKGKEIHTNRNFYLRRYFRIAPLYYLGIIYYFLFYSSETTSAFNVFSNFLFVHGLSPYWIDNLVPGGWSITVEMTFYLIFPFIAKKINTLNQAVKFTLFSCICTAILKIILIKYPLIHESDVWAHYLFLFFPNHLPVFGIGIIAYFIIDRKDYQLSPFSLILLFIVLIIQFIWETIEWVAFIPNHLFFGAAFLVLLLALQKKEYVLVVNKVTCFMGKISYSAYLVHFAVLFFMSKINFVDFVDTTNNIYSLLNYLIRFCLVVLCTAFISYLTFRIIEIPFQNLGKKIIAKLEMNQKKETI